MKSDPIDLIPVPVFTTSGSGEVLTANQTARDQFGVVPGTRLAETRLSRTYGLSALLVRDASQDVLLRHGLDILRVRVRPAGDALIWLLEDVRQRERAVAAAGAEERMRFLGSLSSGLAHEVGNPLASISAIVQLLQLRDLPGDTRDKLAQVEQQTDRITAILARFLEFARPGPSDPQPHDLRGLVQQAWDVARTHGPATRLQLLIDGDARAVAPAAPIRTVFLQLISNAAEAQPAGGRLEIRLKQADSGASAAFVDSGPGLDAAALERLFLPFYTSRDVGCGRGLGLAIARSIAEAAGGRLDVVSAPGTGSTFTVTLPSAP